MFYKENKSIEISCTSPTAKKTDVEMEHPIKVDAFTTSATILEKTNQSNIDLCNCVDYLISDTPTGRYYTCYTLNERSGQIDEIKLCLDNIPSFKENLKKLLNYSNILLKRLNSINYLTTYLTCKNLADKNLKFNLSVDDETNEIKTQCVITDVGHFKYFYNNTIYIQFMDKIRLYVDSEAINSFHIKTGINEKCKCVIVLPDLSQHEVNFASQSSNNDEINSINNFTNKYFSKYINFLNQWMKHLFPEKFQIVISEEEAENNIDINSIKYHVNRLKLFNFTLEQDLTPDESIANIQQQQQQLETNQINNEIESFNPSMINEMLKKNSEFLKNISK